MTHPSWERGCKSRLAPNPFTKPHLDLSSALWCWITAEKPSWGFTMRLAPVLRTACKSTRDMWYIYNLFQAKINHVPDTPQLIWFKHSSRTLIYTYFYILLSFLIYTYFYISLSFCIPGLLIICMQYISHNIDLSLPQWRQKSYAIW